MISANDLSEEQLRAINQWAEEGSQLADIQKRLMGQFGLNVTYMDTRFLVLDLGIELKTEEVPEEEPAEDPEAEEISPEPLKDEAGLLSEAPPGGGLTVTTDELARPGAIVSGTVTFSDGEKAVWMIDQLGRPGLDPDTPGYQPSESDLDQFEQHLRSILQG